MKFTRLLLVTAAAALTAPVSICADEGLFERRIRPVLVDTCLPCHGGNETESGLRVDSRESLLKGGDRGAALVPGRSGESLLVQAIRRTHDDLAMPPGKRLPDDVVADFTRWIDAGASWPDKVALSDTTGARGREHWSCQPLGKPLLPAVQDSAWPASLIDYFILARLEENGLTPNIAADKYALLRRATFDLTGLPPTPGEVDAFLADTS